MDESIPPVVTFPPLSTTTQKRELSHVGVRDVRNERERKKKKHALKSVREADYRLDDCGRLLCYPRTDNDEEEECVPRRVFLAEGRPPAALSDTHWLENTTDFNVRRGFKWTRSRGRRTGPPR